MMAFRYQAIDASGRTVADTIDAGSAREAAELLRDRGLFISKLEDSGDAPARTSSSSGKIKPKGRLRDVVLFTQQMGMLLRSGARVVQALEAVEGQCQRASWRAVVQHVRSDVEEGKPLNVALSRYPKAFPPYYVNVVAAGEASGDVARSFARLANLMNQQQQIRNRVVGALAYPCLLLMMCVGVLIIMFTFVLPRFAEMFHTLDADLPFTTAILLSVSDWCRAHWLISITLVLVVLTSIVLTVRSKTGRRHISHVALRTPVVGGVIRNLIVARICRIWGQLLESRVGLLEAVELTHNSTTNADYRSLLAELSEAITDGNSIGPTLTGTWLVSRTLSAAIITGEESGKLAESLIFVADSLDDENQQVLNSLTRIVEPVILVIMGLVVGTVAVSLFLPLFDMATAT